MLCSETTSRTPHSGLENPEELNEKEKGSLSRVKVEDTDTQGRDTDEGSKSDLNLTERVIIRYKFWKNSPHVHPTCYHFNFHPWLR